MKKGLISGRSTARSGFTLIELLVVVSITALLTGFAVAAFSNFSRSQRLVQSSQDLKAALKDAQGRSLSSVDGLNWGVRLVLNQSDFEIFASPSLSYNAAAQKLSKQLASGVVVSDLTLQSSNLVSVVFSVISGSVAFTSDDGTCLGGSADSSCGGGTSCLAIGVNLQGSLNKRYLKVNERNIFEDSALTPCP
ncbi:MAG: hypothetical protein BMS9Abin34_539 [Patescibacteria group bacterium]|nr:MAG: hypothetical protein BMS9Abin34_539 [Patescibacteria group bacterium]